MYYVLSHTYKLVILNTFLFILMLDILCVKLKTVLKYFIHTGMFNLHLFLILRKKSTIFCKVCFSKIFIFQGNIFLIFPYCID